jgi:phage FluMu protein gp41
MPDIPPEAVSYLREETVSRVQLKLREFEDIKAEQSASTQKRTLSRKNWRVNGGTKYPNYGRKR